VQATTITDLTIDAPPIRGTPANIRTNIIFLETSIIDLHFATESVCLSSFKFFCQAPKEYFISARVTFRPFKVVILIPFESAYMTSY